MQLELGDMLQIVTFVTLLAGLFFGAQEVRHAKRTRFEKGALDVLGIAVKPDHIHASYAMLDLPEDVAPEVIANSEELRRAANTLMVQYEYLGNLVYQRIVPLQTLDLLVGGVIRACWHRMRPYIEDQREKRNLPNIAEWFQWLAERLEQYGRPEKSLGTHLAFRDWKP
jgi:hypothetical protein